MKSTDRCGTQRHRVAGFGDDVLSDREGAIEKSTTSLGGLSITAVVPVKNGALSLPAIVSALATQELLPSELIAPVTTSTDASKAILMEAAFKVIDVPIGEFGHGRTRNAAAESARGDVVVFLTQDAIPINSACLRRLVEPIRAGTAAASFARHFPRRSANPLERFAREANYPAKSRVVTSQDAAALGVRAFFFSNVCSAIKRDVFVELGGFPTHTIMNEDMVFASRLLRAGHAIAYVSDAVVEHSHDYSLWQTFQRYFDIGVVLEQAKDDLRGGRATAEGIRYVWQLFTWLWRQGQYAWLPRAFAESAAKWTGTFLGKRHRLLPLTVKRRLSMHPGLWHTQP